MLPLFFISRITQVAGDKTAHGESRSGDAKCQMVFVEVRMLP